MPEICDRSHEKIGPILASIREQEIHNTPEAKICSGCAYEAGYDNGFKDGYDNASERAVILQKQIVDLEEYNEKLKRTLKVVEGERDKFQDILDFDDNDGSDKVQRQQEEIEALKAQGFGQRKVIKDLINVLKEIVTCYGDVNLDFGVVDHAKDYADYITDSLKENEPKGRRVVVSSLDGEKKVRLRKRHNKWFSVHDEVKDFKDET